MIERSGHSPLRPSSWVNMCLECIWACDDNGPSLVAVMAINPTALDTARMLDRERGRSGAAAHLVQLTPWRSNDPH